MFGMNDECLIDLSRNNFLRNKNNHLNFKNPDFQTTLMLNE
jgi:hypothetical protein